MQLEGAQLHAEHIMLGVGGAAGQAHAHVSRGNVAGGGCIQTTRGKHLRGHFGGGGLAVGSSDADPRRRLAGPRIIRAQTPRKFHLAHHGNTTTLRFENERSTRIEHRRGHHIIDLIPIHLVEGMQISIAFSFVYTNDMGAALPQHLGQRSAGHSQSGNHHCLIRYLHDSSQI